MCLTSESLLDTLFVTAPYGMTKVCVSVHNYLIMSYVMAICNPHVVGSVTFCDKALVRHVFNYSGFNNCTDVPHKYSTYDDDDDDPLF